MRFKIFLNSFSRSLKLNVRKAHTPLERMETQAKESILAHSLLSLPHIRRLSPALSFVVDSVYTREASLTDRVKLTMTE